MMPQKKELDCNCGPIFLHPTIDISHCPRCHKPFKHDKTKKIPDNRHWKINIALDSKNCPYSFYQFDSNKHAYSSVLSCKYIFTGECKNVFVDCKLEHCPFISEGNAKENNIPRVIGLK